MNQDSFVKKAKLWSFLLGHLPGVLAIFLSGSVAQNKATQKSDIDFFVVARLGQIWTARFFVFSILKIFGQMRTNKRHAGKICPNHFITNKNLEITEKDAYSANLFSHIIPLYDPYCLHSEFIKINKNWIKKFGEKIVITETNKGRKKNSEAIPVSLFLEKWLKFFQIKKVKSNPEYLILGSKIVLKDTELRFHPKPKNLKSGEAKCCFPPSRGN